MGKRILLFIVTNILVVITISILINLLGVRYYIENTASGYGLNLQALLIFCLIWGFVGAFISLALSKVMAKMMMGLSVIDPRNASGIEAQLVATVHRLAKAAGLTQMPEVAMYESEEVNAFATGPTRSSSLVAVSSGLLRKMEWSEVEGVLGHEVAHIANGDMVTMALLQGVVNAFVMFLSRVVAFAISTAMSRSDDREGASFPSLLNFILTIVFDIIFTLLGSLVVAAFSRYREYRADAGGASLAGSSKMIAALERLKSTQELVDTNTAPSMASMKISNKKGFLALFSTHPPLKDRIQRLQNSAAGWV
ncbi:MAG TPA: protease HtpX [Turneriella sp.]|nr:protease HtpX [Turneriella sp.]